MIYDLLIIGGGINGCAIAREAALNGWSVLLVERDDLASHTSSASSKLIHGGLRYLETREFRLVRHALQERKRLLAAAPHLIRPLPFIIPHENAVRPAWMVRAGLLLYDLLAGPGNLSRSRMLRKGDAGFRLPLRHRGAGFVYQDCAVDDSRLTILNAVDAASAGADIRTRTGFVFARRTHAIWTVTLSDGAEIEARAIINATGPWLAEVNRRLSLDATHGVRLVKGSHILLPSLYAGDHAYLLQQPDRRVVFALPWHAGTTMIGTTEEAVATPDAPAISGGERTYLLAAANAAFARQSRESDIRGGWSGVRPLVEDGASDDRTATRDYRLDLDMKGAPVLSVLGGKITTARRLGEDALRTLAPALGRTVAPVTRDRPFPGGRMPVDVHVFADRCLARWPFLGPDRTTRMVRAYGMALTQMLEGVDSAKALGIQFGHGLSQLEVDWLVAREWARTTDDILWRRTKLGMVFDSKQVRALERYLKETAT